LGHHIFDSDRFNQGAYKVFEIGALQKAPFLLQ